MPVLLRDALIDERVAAIRAFHIQAGAVRAELDLSGGIDSAVVAGLLHLALGRGKTTLIFLGINSNPDALARAQGLAGTLGEPLINFDGTPLFTRLLTDMAAAMKAAGYDMAEIDARVKNDPTILGSIRSTLRAPWGRAANRLTGGGIRHGTGNECEDSWLRFYQKGGDGEVDTNPISMLSKGEVYQLARALGRRLNAVEAYERIISATPSADLWSNGDQHNDQNEIVNYLGVRGYPVYSTIGPDDEYVTVGLIERVSRFLSRTVAGEVTFGALLFDDNAPESTVESICQRGRSALNFNGIAPDDVKAVLLAAKRIERATRHKWNPNCPSLGSRGGLVSAGILTNILPT
jgi:NH3-dependent NAD+ synthetase